MAQIRVILTDKEKTQILTDAIETQSIHYWANDPPGIVCIREKNGMIRAASFSALDGKGVSHGYKINPSHIQMGVDRLLNPKFVVSDSIRKAVKTQDWDSEVYDCIIQAVCFAEIIYG